MFLGVVTFDQRKVCSIAPNAALGHQEERLHGPSWSMTARKSRVPMDACETLEQDDLVLCGEGRLSNHSELCSSRGLPRGASMLEAVAASFRARGENFAAELRGSFALALWQPATLTLRLYRDHFGATPLYFWIADDALWFSSALPPLVRRLPRRTVDTAHATSYLAGTHQPGSTFYQEIRRVPAATCLSSRGGVLTARRYWSPCGQRERYQGDYGAVLEAAFEQSIARCLQQPGRAALMLSGGLDSSAILACAPPGTLRPYTIGFPPEERCDEGSYVAETLKRLGVLGQRVESAGWAPWEGQSALEEQTGEPVCRANLHFRWNLYPRLIEDGIEVLLDGHDGDTVLSHGYERLPSLLLRGALWSLLRESRTQAAQRRVPLLRYLRGVATGLLVPQNVRRAQRRTRTNLASAYLRVPPPETLTKAHTTSHLANIAHPFQELSLERLHCIGRHHEIAARHPYFDVDLIECALRAPVDLKLHHGHNRFALRSLSARRLPRSVAWRREKTVFSHQARTRLHQRHRERIVEMLCHPPTMLEDLVDVERLREDWHQQRRLNDQQWSALARACSLGLWASRHKPYENRREIHD